MMLPPGAPPLPPPGAALGGAPGMGIPGRPDSPDVTQLVNRAADLLQQALGQEKDPEDKAMISELVARIHKFAGSQQSLLDKATGAGPGAKFVRKSAPPGGPGY